MEDLRVKELPYGVLFFFCRNCYYERKSIPPVRRAFFIQPANSKKTYSLFNPEMSTRRVKRIFDKPDKNVLLEVRENLFSFRKMF